MTRWTLPDNATTPVPGRKEDVMTEIDLTPEAVERMCRAAPFADNTAGIPEMVATLRALSARVVELEARARDAALDALAAYGQASDAYEAQLKVEAEQKVCKAFHDLAVGERNRARNLNDVLTSDLAKALRRAEAAEAALATALAAQPAPVTVHVKPLVWEDFDGRGAKASAYYQANYLIQFWKSEGKFEVALSFPGYQTGYDGERWHPTIEAAKAAAQADYEARILAALAGDKP
jgi:hypothetical protein